MHERRSNKHPNKYLALKNVIFPVTSQCTLKCRGCASLIHYSNDSERIEPELVCRDIDLMMKHVNYTLYLSISGGEPFIVKELPKVFAHAYKYRKKYKRLTVATNGTIVPPDEILEAMRKYKVVCAISDYGEKSANRDNLIEKLGQYKISFVVSSQLVWYAIHEIVQNGGERSAKHVEATYRACMNVCNAIINGKLYHCAFLAYGDILRAYPDDARNYVDLLDETICKLDIMRYKSKESIPSGCRYCSGYNFSFLPQIPVAEQLKEPLPYTKHL